MASVYYRDVGNLGSNIPGGSTPIPGGIYYTNVVLQDPSVYNFYKQLGGRPEQARSGRIGRPSTSRSTSSCSMTVLGLQLAYDHQDFTSGAEQWMAGENYNINIDINNTYANGALNGGDSVINSTGKAGSDGIGDNVGRPYFGNGASAPGLNYQNHTIREGIRFTPTLELRASDFLGNSAASPTHHRQA